jgi:hypothetical protein
MEKLDANDKRAFLDEVAEAERLTDCFGLTQYYELDADIVEALVAELEKEA